MLKNSLWSFHCLLIYIYTYIGNSEIGAHFLSSEHNIQVKFKIKRDNFHKLTQILICRLKMWK